MEGVFIVATILILAFLIIIFTLAMTPQEADNCTCKGEGPTTQKGPPPVLSEEEQFYNVMSILLERGVITYNEYNEIQTKALPYL